VVILFCSWSLFSETLGMYVSCSVSQRSRNANPLERIQHIDRRTEPVLPPTKTHQQGHLHDDVWIVLRLLHLHSLRLMVVVSKPPIFLHVLATHAVFRPSGTPLQILVSFCSDLWLCRRAQGPPRTHEMTPFLYLSFPSLPSVHQGVGVAISRFKLDCSGHCTYVPPNMRIYSPVQVPA